MHEKFGSVMMVTVRITQSYKVPALVCTYGCLSSGSNLPAFLRVPAVGVVSVVKAGPSCG